MQSRIHAIISGKVQGVTFRYHAGKLAKTLGIKGWIKNNSNGTVELIAEGEEIQLQTFLTWCHNGPQHAQVATIDAKWQEPTGEFQDFKIKYWWW